MKIKCLKFECQECGKVSTIQLFFRSNGELAYGRARHYIGRVNGKPQFDYHKQNLEYLQNKIPKDTFSQIIGQLDQQKNADLDKAQLNSKVELAGPMGFEPMTFSLEG
jgi:hypothetical protein